MQKEMLISLAIIHLFFLLNLLYSLCEGLADQYTSMNWAHPNDVMPDLHDEGHPSKRYMVHVLVVIDIGYTHERRMLFWMIQKLPVVNIVYYDTHPDI